MLQRGESLRTSFAIGALLQFMAILGVAGRLIGLAAGVPFAWPGHWLSARCSLSHSFFSGKRI
jgi:hypothetical protein